MMYLWVSYKQKNMQKNIFYILTVIEERRTDLGIRIRIKMSRIPNTNSYFKLFKEVKIL